MSKLLSSFLILLFFVGIVNADNLVYKILVHVSVVNNANINKIKKFTNPIKGQPLYETKLFNSGSTTYMWLEICSTNTIVSNTIDDALVIPAIKDKVFLIQKSWIDYKGDYQNSTLNDLPADYYAKPVEASTP